MAGPSVHTSVWAHAYTYLMFVRLRSPLSPISEALQREMANYDCFPSSPNWYLSRCCDVSSKNNLLGYCARTSLIFLDVKTDVGDEEDVFRFQKTIAAHAERATGISFLAAYDTLHCASSGDDGKCRVWNVETASMVAELDVGETTEDGSKTHRATTLHSSAVSKSQIVVGNEKGSFYRWDFLEGQSKKFSPFYDVKKSHKIYPITAIACSPHSADVVAVGYTEGVILVYDLTGNGHVIHKLRGHDEEIQSLHWRPPFEDEPSQLASGARDAHIRVWDTQRGMEEVSMRLPTSRKGEGDQRGGQTWTPVAWLPGKKSELIGGGYHGELLHWSIGENGKPKSRQVYARSSGHTRMIFNVCTNDGSVESEGDGLQSYAITVGQDRNVIAWDLKNLELRSSIITFGGFVYALEVSPMDPTLLAIGCGDNCVRVWRQSPGNPTTTFWNGIRAMVTCINWHPEREGHLAYGTSDGRVGSLDINRPGKHPIISTVYHRKTVYVVKWGPRCFQRNDKEEDGEDDEGRGDKHLFSVGDGNILMHNLSTKEKMKAVNLNEIIAKSNSLSGKMPDRTALAWNLNYTLVAIGNEDGTVEIFAHPHLKLMIRLSGHLKLINCIAWKCHRNEGISTDTNGCSVFIQGGTWLATGGGDNKVCVFDLSTSFTSDPNAEVTNIYPKKAFGQHKGRVTGLAWSPHEPDLLASAAYDGSVQIWNLGPNETKFMICNFRDHRGRVCAVTWDGSRPNILHSGADDFYLCSWDKTKQRESEPPLENEFDKRYHENVKKKKELRRKGREESKDTRKNKSPPIVNGIVALKSPPHSTPSPAPEERKTESTIASVVTAMENATLANGIEESCNFSEGAGESLLANDEIADLLQSKEEELLLQSLTENVPSPPVKPKKDYEPEDVFARNTTVQLSNVKKPKLFRNTLGMFNNVTPEDRLESLMNLVHYKMQSQVPQAEKGIVKFRKPKPVEELVDECPEIGALSNRLGVNRLFDNEKKIIAANDVDAVTAEHNFQLEFLRGNISKAIDEAILAKKLSDWMVSMAIMTSPYLRQKACIAYAEQLIHPSNDDLPDPKKAAFYLLACNMVYEAIQVLEEFKLFREALCLAKARLREEDPIFHRLYVNWARFHLKNGQPNQGAHCFITAGEFHQAAGELRKRKDENLIKAAEYVEMIGHGGVTNGNLKHAMDYIAHNLHQNDWSEALTFCLSFHVLQEYIPNVLVHRALIMVAGKHLGFVETAAPFSELVNGLKAQRFFELDVDEASVKAVDAMEKEGEEWTAVVRAQMQCLTPTMELTEARFLTSSASGSSTSRREFVLIAAVRLAQSVVHALLYQSLDEPVPETMRLSDIVTPMCDNMVACARQGEFGLAWHIHRNFFPYGLEEFIPDLHLSTLRQADVQAKELFFQLAAIFDLYGNWWDSANSKGRQGERAEEDVEDDEEGETEAMSVEDMQCWLDILLPKDPPMETLPPEYAHLHPSRAEAVSVLLGYVSSDPQQTKENCHLLLGRIESLSDAPQLSRWAVARQTALKERFGTPQ